LNSLRGALLTRIVNVTVLGSSPMPIDSVALSTLFSTAHTCSLETAVWKFPMDTCTWDGAAACDARFMSLTAGSGGLGQVTVSCTGSAVPVTTEPPLLGVPVAVLVICGARWARGSGAAAAAARGRED
jgi:hypothetical protein